MAKKARPNPPPDIDGDIPLLRIPPAALLRDNSTDVASGL